MPDPAPQDLNKILQDLSTASFPGTRRNAARILGQLSTSGVEIVQALAAAVATDGDPEVRSAAVLALQAPVHQEFIKDHPDLMQQAIESAVRGKQQQQEETNEKITEEFQRLLHLEKRAYLLFFLTIFALFASLILVVTLDVNYKTANTILRIFQFAVFVVAILFIWRSWRKWRCPNCDSWLGGWKAGINVWFASGPLRCPHCGARLL